MLVVVWMSILVTVRSTTIMLRQGEHILTSVDFINNDVLLCFCLYLSTCSINYVCSSISGLYCGAHQFDLPDLSQACVDFVERCLRHNRSKQILSSARAYSHFKYTGELFDKVCY